MKETEKKTTTEEVNRNDEADEGQSAAPAAGESEEKNEEKTEEKTEEKKKTVSVSLSNNRSILFIGLNLEKVDVFQIQNWEEIFGFLPF